MNTVLYPFIEEAFCEETEGAVTEICKLGRSGTVNPMFIVNRHGRITDLFKRERVSFFELGIKRLVGANDFYLKTLFRLFSSSMPLFIFLRTHQIDAVHFHDVSSALSWASAVKMYRIPFIVSLQTPEKYSRYSLLTLKDAARLTCPTQTVKDFLPSSIRDRVKIMPTMESVPFVNEKQALKIRKDFFKKERLDEDTVILAAETGENLSHIEQFARALSEKTGHKVLIFINRAGENTENLRFVEKDFSDIFPLCRAFAGLKPMCMNSAASYRAMLSGLPVFALAEGAYPEFIFENETGFLMRTFKPEEQAEIVVQKLADAEQMSKTGKQAKESMNIMFKNTESLWKSMFAELWASRKGFSKK